MEKSERFGFNLPSRSAEDIADIDKISDNFRIIDGEMVTNEDVKEIVDTKANLEFVDLEIEELAYVSGLKEGAHIYELEKIIEAGSSGAYELYFTDGTQLITSAHDSFKVGKKYLISTTLDPEKGYIFDIVAEVIDLKDKVNIEDIDQTYNPESPNAQSGIAVAEALSNVGGGGTWEKIADITITKEMNGIDATTEEFPNLAKCKEFITRLIFPKTETALTLGATRFYINDTHFFRVNSTGTLNSGISEIRCHTIIADKLIYTVGNESVRGHANVVGNAYILVGNLFTDTPQEIRVFLNDTTKYLPIGTQFVIYGKVEG